MEMENEKKIMRMLIQMQSDDLNHADELADYAAKAKMAGDEQVAQKIAARAKERTAHYAEDEKMFRDYVEKMKGAGDNAPESVQGQCLAMMLEAQRDRYHMVRSKIDAL